MAKAELVLFPSAGTGHLVPAIGLAKLIIKTNQQISVLVIIFHLPIYNSATIESYIESESRQLDSTRCTFLILPPLSNPPSPTSSNFFYSIVELQRPLVKEAIDARSTKPAAFILDMMCVNFIDIAKELQIPSYIFFTAGASLLSLQLHLQEVVDGKGLDLAVGNCNSNAELDIPGFKNKVPANVLPLVFCDKENEWSTLVHDISRRFRETKGILVNTFMELEPYCLQALHNRHCPEPDKFPLVYPIGPIIALDGRPTGGRIIARDSMMRWLDEQPSSSVVFLCFGSLGSFDEKQVKEIANGLERSGQRFLWSLRKPSPLQSDDKVKNNIVLPCENETFEEALPPSFLDRTINRGKVIGWAPQTEILAHPSIGGFVSHCGWNSILESIWYGVPIATWPVYSEQQLNAFELVKEYELAFEIRIDYRRNLMEENANITVMAEEVEAGVNKLMGMNDKIKDSVRKMRDTSRDVLQLGGSSHTWLTRFLTQVLALQ